MFLYLNEYIYFQIFFSFLLVLLYFRQIAVLPHEFPRMSPIWYFRATTKRNLIFRKQSFRHIGNLPLARGLFRHQGRIRGNFPGRIDAVFDVWAHRCLNWIVNRNVYYGIHIQIILHGNSIFIIFIQYQRVFVVLQSSIHKVKIEENIILLLFASRFHIVLGWWVNLFFPASFLKFTAEE